MPRNSATQQVIFEGSQWRVQFNVYEPTRLSEHKEPLFVLYVLPASAHRCTAYARYGDNRNQIYRGSDFDAAWTQLYRKVPTTRVPDALKPYDKGAQR